MMRGTWMQAGEAIQHASMPLVHLPLGACMAQLQLSIELSHCTDPGVFS